MISAQSQPWVSSFLLGRAKERATKIRLVCVCAFYCVRRRSSGGMFNNPAATHNSYGLTFAGICWFGADSSTYCYGDERLFRRYLDG